jgi:large subunit ribosomal protein L30
MATKKIKIKLTRSVIGKPEKQRRIVAALGLRKLNHEVVQEDTPSIRGMIRKIPHMFEVADVK